MLFNVKVYMDEEDRFVYNGHIVGRDNNLRWNAIALIYGKRDKEVNRYTNKIYSLKI